MPIPSHDQQTIRTGATSDLPTMPMNGVPDLAVTVGTGVLGAQSGKRPHVPTAPLVIGGYRRTRQLGVGGMGEVHLAQHERLNRQVALKLMRPNVATDSEFSQRFLRESKAMAAVNHPNVVAIHDAGEAEGYLYMAIEFVDGIDLSKLLKTRGTIDEATAIKILISCCKGLEAIHAAGLVHRDIKPANIFLDRKGEPKIGDLGLARHVDGEDRMTMTGSAWGTPSYMPPEQLRGVADIDIRCDIYALGAAFFTVLTGSEPFSGATSFVITTKIMTEIAPDPRSVNRTISAASAAIIRTCLEKDREKRYPTPTAMRVDLERARDALPLAFAQVVGGSSIPGTDSNPSSGAPPPLAGAKLAITTPRRSPAALPSAGSGLQIDPVWIKLLVYTSAVGLLVLVWWSLQGETKVGPRKLATPGPEIGAAAPTEKPTSPWMTQMGRDQFGKWATIRVENQQLRLRHLPPTSGFIMGSPQDEGGRGPSETRHDVELRNGFWIAETEVPSGLWHAVSGTTSPNAVPDALPATDISWANAQDFIFSLNSKVPGLDARLPTEAQWEYACRGGSKEAFAAGPQPDKKEWLALPDRGPRAVGQGTPNRFGLFDMHGNVTEWCLDSWDGTTPLPATAVTDPKEDFGRLAIVRGGSYASTIAEGRSAARRGVEPQEHLPAGGFRFIVLDR